MQGFANLPHTRGLYRARRLMELQAGGLERQVQKRENAADFRLRVFNQLLVGNLQDIAGIETFPMRHHAPFGEQMGGDVLRRVAIGEG